MANNDGHRQRVRERFLKEGLQSFQPYEVLEMLLHYSIPVQDTKERAKELIKTFGSVENVLRADKQRLLNIKGIGEKSVAFFKFLEELETYRRMETADRKYIKDKNDAEAMANKYLCGAINEQFYIVLINAESKVLAVEKISEGSIDNVSVNMARVVDVILKYTGVKSVLLMHNHPSGTDNPSKEDVETTSRIEKILVPLEIEIFDHIIVAGEKCVSMRERNFVADEV